MKILNLKICLIKTKVKKSKYKIQRNYRVNLLYKTRKKQILDIEKVSNKKKFRKSVKPHFGKGDSNSERIIENNSTKTNEK